MGAWLHGRGLHEPRPCPFIHFSGLGPPPRQIHFFHTLLLLLLLFLPQVFWSSGGFVIPVLPVCCREKSNVQSLVIGYWLSFALHLGAVYIWPAAVVEYTLALWSSAAEP